MNTHYTCTHTHTFTHIHIHTYTHSHIYTFTHIHIHTYTHSHIYTFTIHIHTHTYTHCTHMHRPTQLTKTGTYSHCVACNRVEVNGSGHLRMPPLTRPKVHCHLKRSTAITCWSHGLTLLGPVQLTKPQLVGIPTVLQVCVCVCVCVV